MRVTVFQCNAEGLGQAERLARLGRAIDSAGEPRPGLVVCPELFMSGYNVGEAIPRLAETVEGPFARAVSALARKTGTAICYGYPEQGEGVIYNSAACFGPDGALIANHRKLGIPPGFEPDYFSPGDRPTLFDLRGLRFAILICYDAEFPEPARHAALGGAQVLLVPTALRDVWGVVAHSMMPTRAFENGVYVVYANHAGREGDHAYLGASCIASPTGDDLARAGEGEEVIAATVDPARVAAAQARLPYLRDLQALASSLGTSRC